MSDSGEFGGTPDTENLCKLYIGQAIAKEYARSKAAKDNGRMLERIRAAKMPTVWSAKNNVISRAQFCPLTNAWFWSQVAKCSCGGEQQCPAKSGVGEAGGGDGVTAVSDDATDD